MDFRRNIRQLKRPEGKENKYPHNVMLYTFPPIEDIKLVEFQELALERVSLLRIFENANTKNLRLLSDEWKNYINEELNREGLKDYMRLCNGGGMAASSVTQDANLKARRRDYISHFILRLAYCGSQDNQSWFKAREIELFKYKFSSLTNTEIKKFLDLNKLNYNHLTEEQKNELKSGLYDSTASQSITKIEMLDFYKVPFVEATELVKSRRCFLKDGFAYISTLDLISIIALRQEHEIELGLQSAQRYIKDIQTDERLGLMLKSLHNSYIGKDYTTPKSSLIQIEIIDQLSKKSFPLCMRACHEHLRSSHHLKHHGRMQYGLFLKGIGISEEDAVRFWRDEFTKLMDAETFNKRYEYNIHHNYGKRGSMINYSPYSCLKIISDTPGVGEVHGCPYKTWDQSTLKTSLSNYGLSAVDAEDVLSFSRKGHYQLACSKFFQVTHRSKMEIAINHPNQYFEESQNIIGNRDETRKMTQNLNENSSRIFEKPKINGSVLFDDRSEELWDIAEDIEIGYVNQNLEQSSCEDKKT